jgi:2-aminoethylphosphonate-pyruvate transaminase
MGFVIARRTSLERSAGNSGSLVMDLLDQWQYMQKTGQWRFTPPTHVLAALRAAIDQYQMQGGLPARLARYTQNCAALVSGMRALGFKTFLPDAVQAPIIVTFHAPPDPAYDFTEFYRRVRELGFILYPGKLTAVETFRVGCIGAIGAETLKQAVGAIGDALREMGVRRLA